MPYSVSDNFADELETMISSVLTGKEVVSMDEAQRREYIYGEWYANMASVWRALDRNAKIILAPGDNEISEVAERREPVVALLRKNYNRSPDRIILTPDYQKSGKPDEVAKMVSVTYWPTFFPENYDDESEEDTEEKDFDGAMSYAIDSLEFKKELAKFIAGRMD